MANVTRRDFLKTAGLAIGASTLACAGFTYSATRSPVRSLPESSFGDVSMEKHVLIAYASKCGSTAEIARTVGETISKNGIFVDVKPINEIDSIDGYDAVITGSAIRYGAWLSEATQFLIDYQERLNHIPTAAFTVHVMNLGNTPEEVQIREGYLNSIKEYISPKSVVIFRRQNGFFQTIFL